MMSLSRTIDVLCARFDVLDERLTLVLSPVLGDMKSVSTAVGCASSIPLCRQIDDSTGRLEALLDHVDSVLVRLGL